MRPHLVAVIAALAVAGVAMSACGPRAVDVHATMLPADGSTVAAPDPTATSAPTAASSPTPEAPATTSAATNDEGGNDQGADASPEAPAEDGNEVGTAPQGSGPAWVEVSSVGIRHDLRPEGLSSNGTINPASGNVIWFTGYDRAVPGQVGTAVIAGHVDSGGRPDVFHDLPGVSPGDTVRIGYANGDVLTLRVVDTELADKDQVARNQSIWGKNTSTRRVALITCDDALGFRDDGHRVANYVVIAEAI